MAEEKVDEKDEKKIVSAYTVKRYANGDIDVEDAKLNGSVPMTSEAIFKDIEDVSQMINLQRIQNASAQGAARFYAELERARAAQAKQAAAASESPELPKKSA